MYGGRILDRDVWFVKGWFTYYRLSASLSISLLCFFAISASLLTTDPEILPHASQSVSGPVASYSPSQCTYRYVDVDVSPL